MARRRTEGDRQETAARWSAWLRETATRRGKRQIDLIRESDGVLSSATLSQWWDGKYSARPDLAILVADLLGVSEADALRAAGHETIAERMERRGLRGQPSAAAARRFGTWLRTRAEERSLDQDYFMEITKPESPFDRATLEAWWGGLRVPDPVNAALLGVILDVDGLGELPIEALRAAGHGDVADTAQALRRMQDESVRRATEMVADPVERERLLTDYKADQRRATELLELRARAAGRPHQGNGKPAVAP